MQKQILSLALPLLLLAPILTSCTTVSRLSSSLNPTATAAPNSTQFSTPTATNVEALEAILKENATDLEKLSNQQWVFQYDGVPMMLMTSPQFDRMRLIAPIIEAAELTGGELQAMLQANFHSALDARYALSNGVIFAAYLHPLSSLAETDFRSALIQTSQLVKNFGTTYSSGGPSFGQEQ